MFKYLSYLLIALLLIILMIPYNSHANTSYEATSNIKSKLILNPYGKAVVKINIVNNDYDTKENLSIKLKNRKLKIKVNSNIVIPGNGQRTVLKIVISRVKKIKFSKKAYLKISLGDRIYRSKIIFNKSKLDRRKVKNLSQYVRIEAYQK